MQEEFRLLGAPFEDRGRATDEYIQAFKALWTEERPVFKGKLVSFEDVVFAPKPIQKPHPPIWVGGESPAALRRAAALGDAWYPGNNNQQKPLDTAPRLAAGIGELRAAAAKAGRDPAAVGVALIAQAPYGWKAERVQDGSARRMFTGSSADMLEDAAALAKVGVGHVALRLDGASVAEAVEKIERFGSEVIAKAG
jgi:alkanesulfonate monooxygenase SsuD/methylene tetrahydromethanopterin reductase-like flavin-dependent oxidoreductase (luciferase family)